MGNIYGGIKFYLTVDENLVYSSDETVKETDNSLGYSQFLKSLPKGMLVGFLLILIVMFLGSTNASIAKPFIIVYLTEKIESDPILASMAFIPAGLVSMLLAPYLGKIADRIDAKIVISFAAMSGAITTWFLINTTSLWVFSILLLIDTTIATTSGLLVQSIMSQISIAHRGKVFGLQTFSADLGAVFGPIFGGILWDSYGSRSPFIFSIIVELMLIPFYILAITSLKPHLAKDNGL
ncbi:MAG: MFS transporter [Candidatus Kariarchaeaceae archaeon]